MAVPGAERAHPSRDAIIYIPGLTAYGEYQVPVDGLAMRLAAALDRQARTRSARFNLSEGQVVEYSDGLLSRKITIQRQDDGQLPQALMDVFEFEYRDSIRERYEQRNPLRQALAIAWLLLMHVPHFLGFLLLRSSKGRGDKLQLTLAGSAVAVMALYLTLLIFTAVGTGIQGVDELGNLPLFTPGQELPVDVAEVVDVAQVADGADGADGAEVVDVAEVAGGADTVGVEQTPVSDLLAFCQSLVVLLTASGLIAKGNLKTFIQNFTLEYAGMMNYISSTTERSEITGRFTDLLEKVQESGPGYENISVVGYSFGSIVAIDAVFRPGQPIKSLEQVGKLITVASPFDLVRSFWPDYFTGRSVSQASLGWWNVYSPQDVLSSNFRDDESIEAPDLGVATGTGEAPVTPVNLVFGGGAAGQRLNPLMRLLRVRELHTAYWGKSPRASSFATDLVVQLYAADDDFLR